MIRYDVGVVREFFVADCAFSVLFNNLAIEKLPRFRRGPEFSISSWVMRIRDALNTET